MKGVAVQVSARGLSRLPTTSWSVLPSYPNFQAFCNIGPTGVSSESLGRIKWANRYKKLTQNVTQRDGSVSAGCCPRTFCIPPFHVDLLKPPSKCLTETTDTPELKWNHVSWLITQSLECSCPLFQCLRVSKIFLIFPMKSISIFKRKTSAKMSRFS